MILKGSRDPGHLWTLCQPMATGFVATSHPCVPNPVDPFLDLPVFSVPLGVIFAPFTPTISHPAFHDLGVPPALTSPSAYDS